MGLAHPREWEATLQVHKVLGMKHRLERSKLEVILHACITHHYSEVAESTVASGKKRFRRCI